jgi:hypothetical protein
LGLLVTGHKIGAEWVISTLGDAMSEIDLFGEIQKAPVDKFEDFWTAWPKSPRKGAKSSCRKRWDAGLYNGCADQIIKHVEWMKTTDQWRKDSGAYIPAPLVYLNQQRWDGAEIPETRPQEDALEKIKRDIQEASRMPSHVRDQLRKMRGA